MLHWLRQYSFVRYAIIAQEIAIDQHGIHVQTGVLQPNMISTLMMAPVCRNWYTAALPIVENKSWIRPWRTMRTLLARDVSVMVHKLRRPPRHRWLKRRSALALNRAIIHIQAGALQPNMLATPNLAPISRSWCTATLAMVENKPWISTWRTVRAMSDNHEGVMVPLAEGKNHHFSGHSRVGLPWYT